MIQFVCVAWIDAESSAGWQSDREVDDYRLPIVHHVGWVVRRDKKKISLAQGISENEEGDVHWCAVMHIPVSMVKKVTKLPDPRNQ